LWKSLSGPPRFPLYRRCFSHPGPLGETFAVKLIDLTHTFARRCGVSGDHRRARATVDSRGLPSFEVSTGMHVGRTRRAAPLLPHGAYLRMAGRKLHRARRALDARARSRIEADVLSGSNFVAAIIVLLFTGFRPFSRTRLLPTITRRSRILRRALVAAGVSMLGWIRQP